MNHPTPLSVVARSAAVGFLLLGAVACGDDDSTRSEGADTDTSAETGEQTSDKQAAGRQTADEQTDASDAEVEDSSVPVIGAPPAGQIVANIGGNDPIVAEIDSCILRDEGDIMIHSDPTVFPNIDVNIRRTDSGDLDVVAATVSLDDAAEVFILGDEEATLVVDGRYVNVASNSFTKPGEKSSYAGLLRATCE